MNNIKRLHELYIELQEIEKDIKRMEELYFYHKKDNCAQKAYEKGRKYDISRKSEILIEIKKLKKSDLMKDVLLLLHDNKVNEAISIIKKELEDQK